MTHRPLIHGFTNNNRKTKIKIKGDHLYIGCFSGITDTDKGRLEASVNSWITMTVRIEFCTSKSMIYLTKYEYISVNEEFSDMYFDNIF
jgi:hypothetical protein